MRDESSPLGQMLALTFHPCAELFPLMEGEEFEALVADIEAFSLQTPIKVLGNAILDGRNRYRACIKANVEIETEQWVGKDPLAFVLSANLHRRHLNESQRAMIAAKLETMKHGRPEKDANLRLSRDKVARMVSVSSRSVCSAAAVRDHGTPELVQRAERGEVAVSVAVKVAGLSAEEQAKVVGQDEAVLRGVVKKARRAQRERELADATRREADALGTKLYNVIYADPPWQFEPYSRDTGMDRAADNHYPTMTVDEIGNIGVPAAADCVLFLWVTVPFLEHGFTVIKKWGFDYKSACAWHKPIPATGFWFRNQLELQLVGMRGSMPAPAPGEQPPQVLTEPAGKHSEKPAAFAEMIEAMFPNVPKLEMFARSSRLGFDTWGNEVQ
jgi:N6-adenosine-specific RNA methylase IME4/ParB-like chromosome segregation protein Spo0J